MCSKLGKRGPKPGHGGRKIKYNDEFHEIQRQIMRDHRALKRKAKEDAATVRKAANQK